jgi:hypothetical protein
VEKKARHVGVHLSATPEFPIDEGESRSKHVLSVQVPMHSFDPKLRLLDPESFSQATRGSF